MQTGYNVYENKNFINACKRALDEVAGNCLKVGGSVLFDLLSKSNA